MSGKGSYVTAVFNRRARGAVIAVTAAAVLLLSAVPASAADTPPPARDTSKYACPPGQVPPSGFTDTAGNTFQAQIDCLAWYGITQGGPGGRPANEYGPALDVTRDQMASFIVRFLVYVNPSLVPAFDGTNDFVDVPNDNVHMQDINRLAQAGIVQGGPGGRPANEYGPGLSVARDQMASFIGRSLTLIFGADICKSVKNYFDDDNGDVHEACINGLADLAIVQGRAPGVYTPAGTVSRAQMAGFIMRSMDLLVERNLASPPTT